MNWVDLISIIILISSVSKGLSLGLILSMFNMFKLLISIIITKRYYSYVYEYIVNSPKIYNIFKSIISVFSDSKPISDKSLSLIITLFSIIFIYGIISILISVFLKFLSFIFKVPILKKLNQIGGLVFGLVKGMIIIYLLNIILHPIALMFPKSFIGEGILGSFIKQLII